MSNVRVCGCFDSNMEGSSLYSFEGNSLPQTYTRDLSTEITDQGLEGSCVSQALYELVNSWLKFSNSALRMSPSTLLYSLRADKSVNGMSPREGLDLLISKGFITKYSRVNTIQSIKACIISNGGCLAALPVRSYKDSFWEGSEILGGHAVPLVGYDNDLFIFKNSWGLDYGDSGLFKISKDVLLHNLMECWTILG